MSYDDEELEFLVNVQGFKIQESHHQNFEDEVRKLIANENMKVELFLGNSGWED